MKRTFVLAIFVGSALLMSLQSWSDVSEDRSHEVRANGGFGGAEGFAPDSIERIKELMVNHFHVALPQSEQATIYLQEDNEFLLFPTFDNKDDVHLCSGVWRADNRRRTVTFRGLNKCRILNGT